MSHTSAESMVRKHFMQVHQSAENDRSNNSVFSRRLNRASVPTDCTAGGRLFQAREAATLNARSPMVEHRVTGTTSERMERVVVRWMCGVRFKNRASGEGLDGRLGVVRIAEIVRRGHLGHSRVVWSS